MNGRDLVPENEFDTLVLIIQMLQDRGWRPVRIFDDEEITPVEGLISTEIADLMAQVELCHLRMAGEDRSYLLAVCWGNSPEELVYDHSTDWGDLDEVLYELFPEEF